MDMDFINELTQIVTNKKGSPFMHKPFGHMHNDFDEFIYRVKHGLYRGLDEYAACYLLLTHSRDLLRLYVCSPDAVRLWMNDRTFEISFYKFLIDLNLEFFQMFRIRSGNFEKLIPAMFLVASKKEDYTPVRIVTV